MNRPGLTELLAYARAGHADGIIVAKLDRFARNADAIELIADLERGGVKFISASERFDTSTPFGEFALGMMLLVARMFRRNVAENWKDIERRVILERGMHPVVPYGYERGPDGPLIPSSEARVVRRIFELRNQGLNLAEIIHQIDAPTPSMIEALRAGRDDGAVAWTKQTIRAILRNRAYLGEAFKGELVNPDAHQPLVTREAFNAAQGWEGPRGRRTDAPLLGGLVKCAGCGYAMGRSTSRGHARYGCQRSTGNGPCPSPTTATAATLEQHVEQRFLERYGDVSVIGAQDDSEIRDATRSMGKARRELEAWRDDIDMRDILGNDQYRAGLTTRARALNDAEQAHATAVRANQSLTIDAGAWDTFTTPERRELLRAGIDAITLSRAANTRTPISDRCRIIWAGERDDNPAG